MSPEESEDDYREREYQAREIYTQADMDERVAKVRRDTERRMWIPISREKPENFRHVLCLYESTGRMFVAAPQYDSVYWYGYNTHSEIAPPSHWMPLPEPVKKEYA